MAEIPARNELKAGLRVEIVTKEDQGTGRLTAGTIGVILTASKRHPHGIKVRLRDGRVGRVKKVIGSAPEGSTSRSGLDSRNRDLPSRNTSGLDGLYRSPLFGHIREYLLSASAHETIFLFVPYIQSGVLARLLDNVENKVVIVTTWDPADLLSGASDLAVYTYCQEHGLTLYVSEMMHLKVYSVGLNSAIVATGNVSRRGLLPNGNYEVAVAVEHLTNKDRLFFETIRANARLVDDNVYSEMSAWVEHNTKGVSETPALKDVLSISDKKNFLVSALPMTHSVDVLVAGYARIRAGLDPSDDLNVSACIFHDLVNFSMPMGLSDIRFRRELRDRFFAHPFIRRIDGFITPEAYFGRIKEWIQNNCTDVPVPSRRKLTGNVQVLMKWFVELGDDGYVVDVPRRHSQRIRKTTV